MSSANVVLSQSPAWGLTHWLRLLELLALFVVVPVSLTLFREVIPPIPVLLGVGVLTLVILLRDPTFDRSTLWTTAGLGRAIWSILPIWAGCGLAIGLAVYLLRPDALFQFPLTRPWIWVMVMTLYPLFSVIPQSLIYRAFFTHRYQVLFRSRVTMVIAAGVAFALAHVVFKHWLAVILTLVGGILFVRRHLEHRSLLAGAVEHAMYGNMVFTLGLGSFFYHGSSRMTEAGI
jgi:hypothetical protein